jgi:nucleotide-binding universal stress UspA family protein
MRNTDIVVGVDGSPSSWDALRWAVDEAAQRGSRLRIVAAYRTPWPGEDISAGVDLRGAVLEHTECVVAEMEAYAREARPGVKVSGLTVCGATVPVLCAAAAASHLLVVGCRGHRGFTDLLLGATGLQLVTHAPVPVVVVRGSADRSGPVVVGSDGSAGSEMALAMAFEEADRHGCELVAVHAYQPPVTTLGPDARPLLYQPERLHASVCAELEACLVPWREKYPTVAVRTVVEPGEAAHELVDRSAGARLIVVGTRGHGRVTGLLLGSVGQHLLHHAHCPVLIARDRIAN